MRLLLIIFFILFSVVLLKAQTTVPDSLTNKKTSTTDSMSVPEFQLNIDNNSYVPNNIAPFQHKAFSLKLNLDQMQLDSDLNEQYYHNFYLSTSSQKGAFGDNKTQMMNSISRIYENSKPTTMQKIMGMVNFSGAMFLAGYHVYKYYIKKEKQ